MLRIVYESSAGTTVDWVATDHVRLPGVEFTENAEEGTVATSSLLVEDSGGTLDIVGQRRWWAYETAEEDGNKIIACGFVGDREIGRDVGAEPFMVDDDRRWSVGLVDKEQILSDRVLSGPTTDRPAETDIARLTWLLSSGFLSGVGNTLSYIDTIGAVDLSAASFSGQRPYDVLSDCAQQSNKDFFLVKASESITTGVSTYSLWYAFDAQPAYDSTIRLTNIKTEADNTVTFSVHPDMTLKRGPERVFSGVLVRHLGGEVYVQNATTGNAFRYRDAVHPGINVSDQAVALDRANRYLADADAEEDRITCRFVVPKETVNALRAGQRVQFRFTHLPGYDSSAYQYARCVRRTVKQLSDDFYELRAELIPTPQGSATETSALLMRPNSTNDAADPDHAAQEFQINWDNDGDNPKAGDTGSPLVGLIAYQGALAERTGLTILGDGLADVSLAFSVSIVGSGTHTFTAQIRVNGATIASSVRTSSPGGLFVHAEEWIAGTALTATYVARSGDVVTGWVASTIGAVGSHVTLPTGVGNGSHGLSVTGTFQ
jgi:hypothetical protein